MNELVNRLISYLEREKVVRHAPADSGPLPDAPEEQIESIFVGGLFFLEKFSRIIETTVIDRKLEHGRLFVNLHSFSNVLADQRRQRYLKLDSLDNEVYVYGVDNPGSWPFHRISPVRLSPGDGLRHCWFVLYDNPDTTYALVSVGRVVAPGPHTKIQYKGFWTTRRSVAHSVCDYLLRVVNVQYGVTNGHLPG